MARFVGYSQLFGEGPANGSRDEGHDEAPHTPSNDGLSVLDLRYPLSEIALIFSNAVEPLVHFCSERLDSGLDIPLAHFLPFFFFAASSSTFLNVDFRFSLVVASSLVAPLFGWGAWAVGPF